MAADDPAFRDPTKPIGRFYSREEAEAVACEKDWVFREDAGRGYRRVIPSPNPLKIVEQKAILCMLAQGICTREGLRGVDAVIDKDRSCELLAEAVGAELIFFLTAVDRVCLNYHRPNQQELTSMSTIEAREYIRQGHFAPGSMLPKVEAGVRFAESAPGSHYFIGTGT